MLEAAYGKSQAQAVRRGSKEPDLLDHSNSYRTPEASGTGVKFDITQSNARKDSSRGDFARCPANGGILDQLLSEAQSELAKSREYLVWHRNQHQELIKRVQRLENLKALQTTESD